MSWFSGGSSSGGWFGGKVSEEQRQDDQPLAKMAAKPTAVRDWEQQTIAAERLALAGSHEGPARPKWNPFLSLENSEKFDNKMKNMRQMKDQAPAGDIVLRSFEQQVLGAPLDGPAVPAAGSHGHGGENQEVEGVGKGIDGHVIPLMLPWVTWPPQRTRWTPAPDKDDMGHARMSPDQERRCMGLAYYHQGKTYEYYEVACQIEFARNDELLGHLAGCAGLCFHLRHKNSGVASYLYYVRLGSDETAGDELVLARLEASSYDQYDLLPTEIEVLNKYHRGKFLVNDGVHYFRVRSFSGGFMFYFNHAYVGFHEVKEQDKTMATFGHCGIWTYDLEVSVKKMLQKKLEDMEMLDTGTGEELETGFQGVYALLKAQHLVVKSDRMIMQDVFIVWCKLLADIREARMAPFRHLEGAEKAHAQKQMLAEWLSTLYTLQRYAELLTSSDHLKGRRLQLFLNELDHTNPPPPPPPLAAPPTPEDEELHYLYEMQQRKYQKQIEDAGRKVLGKEKFAELKKMTTGSLAQQQEGLVAQKQRQMAAEVRRDFRQHLAALQRNLEAMAQSDCALSAAVLGHLREVEQFMTAIYRFFKCVDINGQGEQNPDRPDAGESGIPRPPNRSPTALMEVGSDDSEEGSRAHAPRPALDRSLAGYVACLNCGHNGVLSEGEAQHLALHLRTAKFGKYAEEAATHE